MDLPCSGSVELTRSCMCCVLRTTCFNARTLTATYTLTAYNEFISQNYRAADLDSAVCTVGETECRKGVVTLQNIT